MIELPAAKVEIYPEAVTVHIPFDRRDEWTQLIKLPAIEKSQQLYVKLGKPRKPRTTGWKSQNHHFNGHIQQFCQCSGDSFDEVKLHIKREAVSMGYPVKHTSWGTVVPISESDASTVECGYLIDTIHRVASDFGYTLKETNE